jgi:hypothetical protein
MNTPNSQAKACINNDYYSLEKSYIWKKRVNSPISKKKVLYLDLYYEDQLMLEDHPRAS